MIHGFVEFVQARLSSAASVVDTENRRFISRRALAQCHLLWENSSQTATLARFLRICGGFLLDLPFWQGRAMIVPPIKPIKSDADSSSQPPADQLAAALNLLRTMIGAPGQQKFLDPDDRPTTKMVYTNGVTLWMLILQRLGGGKSLGEVVSQVLTHDRDLLPDNKRVRDNTLSENSAAYARARKRLPLATILEFSNHVCDYLGKISEPVIAGRRVFILDGTTITLPPTKALREAYPPAPNQHGASVWPVAQLMIANAMQSGCALLPQAVRCCRRLCVAAADRPDVRREQRQRSRAGPSHCQTVACQFDRVGRLRFRNLQCRLSHECRWT